MLTFALMWNQVMSSDESLSELDISDKCIKLSTTCHYRYCLGDETVFEIVSWGCGSVVMWGRIISRRKTVGALEHRLKSELKIQETLGPHMIPLFRTHGNGLVFQRHNAPHSSISSDSNFLRRFRDWCKIPGRPCILILWTPLDTCRTKWNGIAKADVS